MATNRARRMVEARPRRAEVSAFTLVDLLVSMAIIAVLIALILPSIAGVREAARRVVCGSNQRQQGLGIAMFAEDNHDQIPETKNEPKDPHLALTPTPQFTNIVRDDPVGSPFDGLGLLFFGQYLNAPQVFYCPSHHGEHPYAANAEFWNQDYGKIVVNYQYRGSMAWAHGQTDRLTLLSDCLASRDDYSHNVGSNVLRADFSVSWLSDPSGGFGRWLPQSENDMDAALRVSQAWSILDGSPAAIPNPGH